MIRRHIFRFSSKLAHWLYFRHGNWARIARLVRMGKFCSVGAYFTTSDHIEFGQIFLISIF